MVKYPDIQFRLNQDLDRWTAQEFKVGTEDDVQTFYASHMADFESFIKIAKESWDKVSETFFTEISKLFYQHTWPEGEYVGYASMFDCNPRFLNNKTFQVYYQHKAGSNYVTAHELLHFMFYDYAIKKHADLFAGRDTESGIFWDVAEVFNEVVLHKSSLVAVHTMKKQVMDPRHKNFVKYLNKTWQDNQNVDDFIAEAYNFISKHGKN